MSRNTMREQNEDQVKRLESGVHILPDGRVQVVFDMSADGLAYLPGHVFEIVASVQTGIVCDDTRDSINFLMGLFKNMMPSERQALEGYLKRLQP